MANVGPKLEQQPRELAEVEQLLEEKTQYLDLIELFCDDCRIDELLDTGSITITIGERVFEFSLKVQELINVSKEV